MSILALNAGSTSLKLAVFSRELHRQCFATLTGIGSDSGRLALHDSTGARSEEEFRHLLFEEALDVLLRGFGRRWPGLVLAAVGHRVVHGGDFAASAALINEEALSRIAAWAPLAPLHQPLNLTAIEAAREAFPEAVHVACFDTGFHWSLPPYARLVAIPERLRALGIQRYGFHGLSFESVLSQLAEELEPVYNERLVVAHLGGGSSLCAVLKGTSVDTSMGVTPLSGVPMTTRCGDIDAGALLFLLQRGQLDVEQLQTILYQQSGLKGLTGRSGDMKKLLEIRATSPEAEAALEHYCYQVRKSIGALAAGLGGIDRLVFTGGIGANAPTIRAAICSGLDHLGVELDDSANLANARLISGHGSRVPVNTVETDEEAVIARLTVSCLEGDEG
jgi:acetate kinase